MLFHNCLKDDHYILLLQLLSYKVYKYIKQGILSINVNCIYFRLKNFHYKHDKNDKFPVICLLLLHLFLLTLIHYNLVIKILIHFNVFLLLIVLCYYFNNHLFLFNFFNFHNLVLNFLLICFLLALFVFHLIIFI